MCTRKSREFPFPQAKQYSPELDPPSYLAHSALSSVPVIVQPKMYIPRGKMYRHNIFMQPTPLHFHSLPTVSVALLILSAYT